ncbi:helix-turn-helix domain-containing protein [Rhodococcus pyridinivorans]|uniref:Helix-turn-helix domain-containing protein n=1 Tax=Rhodococcus pyridinivorans AK37 TaxID=1114960 RepID=H0JNC3_9NOCA|nr:helix-turn-helix domain-containing protein [Rhodococcus pyridinivorans]EHK84895.1 hypothetical protein AK37_05532 [Rhodococcus pyridinivorans AK37]MCD2142284.1 helix-turn-helix domain-containing protein [Rhodococcus pyridinivorans]UPK63143.1 helix-turn-helix domain-containing protein [Rhodococcus pyridinivorans]
MSNPKKSLPAARVYTIKQAAAALALNEKTIRRRIADGKLPAFRLPGSHEWRIPVDAIDAMIGGA